MATTSGGIGGSGAGPLRECGHPAFDDQLKQQNAVTFKLVKTGKLMNNFVDESHNLIRSYICVTKLILWLNLKN